jgi:glycosyltransferase involved in cell wall biosynthesis
MNTEKTSAENAWEVPDYGTVFNIGKTRPYCVVIPVVNEGERIHSLLKKMAALKTDEIADIIIVDGGTTDGSLEMDFLKEHGVTTLLLKTGPGKLGAQLRCAYSFALHAKYEGIITIDGNDKDNPAAIPAFATALADGIDFAQASRFIAGGHAANTPASRDLAIRWIHAPALRFFSGFHWTDTTQGFRAYSARLLLDEKVAPFRNIFSTYELLAYLSYRAPKLGYKCLELPTERVYPKDGTIPTKISNFRGNLQILKILFTACFGGYNP